MTPSGLQKDDEIWMQEALAEAVRAQAAGESV